jgi:hypothetical protein
MENPQILRVFPRKSVEKSIPQLGANGSLSFPIISIFSARNQFFHDDWQVTTK